MFLLLSTWFQQRLNDILEKECRQRKCGKRQKSLGPQAPRCQADSCANCIQLKAWGLKIVSEESPVELFCQLPFHILDGVMLEVVFLSFELCNGAIF